MSLSGQIAVVTGAGRGIGKSISVSLAGAGAKVVLVSRTAAQLESVQREIESAGGKAVSIRADIARQEDVVRLFNEVNGRFGRLDILVNNAGSGKFVPVKEMRVEDFDAMWNLNVRGLFLCTQQALPIMEHQRNGIIVNISSLAGKNAIAGGAGYAATKWAVRGFAKSLMLEERQYNIRIVTISPGSVDTDFAGHGSDNSRAGKVLSPEDVADAVLAAVSMHPRAMVSEIDIRPTNPK